MYDYTLCTKKSFSTIPLLCVTYRRHYGEYHDACVCVPLLVNNDSATFANIACGEDFNNLHLLVETITTKGLNAQAYIKRAELLSGILKPVQLKSGALQIYAQCHISNITEKSMTKHAWVYFTKQCSLQYCSHSTLSLSSHTGNYMCLCFCCCTGFWHGSSSDCTEIQIISSANPKSITVSICIQDRLYHKKSALCREYIT